MAISTQIHRNRVLLDIPNRRSPVNEGRVRYKSFRQCDAD